jgi:hypothetical protein
VSPGMSSRFSWAFAMEERSSGSRVKEKVLRFLVVYSCVEAERRDPAIAAVTEGSCRTYLWEFVIVILCLWAFFSSFTVFENLTSLQQQPS